MQAGAATRGAEHRNPLEGEAIDAIFRTAEALRHQACRVIEPFGITAQQYLVLRLLKESGPLGLPTSAISERLVERNPGVTRIVDRLVAKGLLLRVRGTTDRRQVVCRITQFGLDLLARMEGAVLHARAVALSGLDEGQTSELIRILARICSSTATS